MSKKFVITALSLAVALFTVWNVFDFCKSDTHSTVAYLAIALNFIAIVKLIQLIFKETKKDG